MGNIFGIKNGRRLFSSQYYITTIYNFSLFLDAYAFTTEGVVGYAIGRRNFKSFMMVVKNSIQISFVTAIIISIVYLIFFKNSKHNYGYRNFKIHII